MNNNYETIAKKFASKKSEKKWKIWHPSLRNLDETVPTSVEYYSSSFTIGKEKLHIRAYKPKDVVEACKLKGKKLHYFRLPPEIIFGGHKDINKENNLLIAETFPTLTETNLCEEHMGKPPKTTPINVWKQYYNNKTNIPIELTANPGAMYNKKTSMQMWEKYKRNM